MATQIAIHDENMELIQVRAALAHELKQLREQKIELAMQEAANDPMFVQDLQECMRDWADLDRDSFQYIDCEPEGAAIKVNPKRARIRIAPFASR